jgi:hypothetical protein
VIQGAKDASDSIGTITHQVSNMTQEAIGTVDTISNGVETSKESLLNYSNSVILFLEDLKTEARSAKSDITERVQARIENASYVIEFTAVKVKIDETMQASADKGMDVVKKLYMMRTNNSLIETLAEHMLMVSDMVSEIQKYEEMIVTFGNVAVGAINDFGVSENRTISLDFRVFFDYLENVENGMEALQEFIEDGPLITLKYELPNTEIRATALVDAMADLSSTNITAVLDSEFNKIFTQIEDTIDVTIDRLRDYIVTQWEEPSDTLLEKMDEVRQILVTIKTTSDSASQDLRTAALVPGMAVGAYGIAIALIVEIFAIVARMKRAKGTLKTIQLIVQNVLYVITYVMVDIYVMVSFLLALLFALIGGLQLSLSMICIADLAMCSSIRYELTPAVKLMIFGVICNTIFSYHLIGTIQGTWARFLGGLRHCCGNGLAHSAADYDLNGTGKTGHNDTADEGNPQEDLVPESQVIARAHAKNKSKTII